MRTTNAVIATLIEQGKQHSPTFRDLVNVIDTTDGLVYVDQGTCPGGYKACLMHSVTLAGPNRMLRAKIDVRRADGGDLIALLGHELQHAIEILRNPGLRSTGQVLSFYQQFGSFGGSNAVETDAAVETELKISQEIRKK